MAAELKQIPVLVGIAGALGALSVLGAAMTIGARLIASTFTIWNRAETAEYESKMAIFITALGISFAAPCLWLAVRIVNRHEPWAKWAAAVTVLTVVLYFASYGPWMRLCVYRFQSMAYIDGGGFYAVPCWLTSRNEPIWGLAPYNSYLKWCVMPARGTPAD